MGTSLSHGLRLIGTSAELASSQPSALEMDNTSDELITGPRIASPSSYHTSRGQDIKVDKRTNSTITLLTHHLSYRGDTKLPTRDKCKIYGKKFLKKIKENVKTGLEILL